MKDKIFTKGVETLVDPINISTLQFLQSIIEGLSIKTQNKMIKKGSKKNPTMGFIVDPYAYFICYEIKDISFFKKQLPDGFEIVKTKIFGNDDEKYTFILGAFNARTSGFFGNRVEAYVICRDQRTGLMSWAIIEYETDTISYDQKNGLTRPNCEHSIITTDYNGDVIVDVVSKNNKKKLKFVSNIEKGVFNNLDQELWLDGNLSITYGKKLSSQREVFSLKFDPKEVSRALEIKLEDLNIEENNWYIDKLYSKPIKTLVFPYAQHFLSDSPGQSIYIKGKKELNEYIKNVDFEKISSYSNEKIKNLLIIIPILLIILIILCLLLIFLVI